MAMQLATRTSSQKRTSPEWRLVTKSFADYAHVNLLYEQTVSTLVAHAGIGFLSEQDDQVGLSKLRHFVTAISRTVDFFDMQSQPL